VEGGGEAKGAEKVPDNKGGLQGTQSRKGFRRRFSNTRYIYMLSKISTTQKIYYYINIYYYISSSIFHRRYSHTRYIYVK